MNGNRTIIEVAVVFGLIVSLCPLSAGRIIYVDDSADGTNHGGCWADALLYLQDALILAQFVEEPVEIRVAQGMYQPDQGTGITPGDREATFRIPGGAVLRGGYAGGGTPDPNERNVELFASILSGDLLGDDSNFTDAQVPLSAPSRPDNSFHVVTIEQAGACELDGFTICGGHATGGSTGRSGPSDGGGALRIQGSFPVVRNCTFIQNWGSNGGAVFVFRSDFEMVSRLEIRNCRFMANASGNYGGAVFTYETELFLADCEFSANTSRKGGGISSHLGDLSLSRCTIQKNRAADGSGLYHVNGHLSLAGCTFEGNATLPPGPARGPATRSGAVRINNPSGRQAVATNCLFKNNRGFSGAAIQGNLTALRGCRFTGNVAYARAGAIDGRGALTCENCLFDGNQALESTAVVRCLGALLFANCTFVENRSPDGYAFSAFGSHGSPVANIFRNCILWGGARGIVSSELRPEYVSVDYSDVQGGWPGVGNIDTDPCFAAPGYWDPNATLDDPDDDFWVGGDYHLKSQAGRWDRASDSWVQDDVTSLCIDAGDPNGPIQDELFPNGGRINIGVYGGTTEASKSHFGGPVCETHWAGDINGDCKVNFDDLLILISQWTSGMAEPAPVSIVEPINEAVLHVERSEPILIRAVTSDPDFPAVNVRFHISHESEDSRYSGGFPASREPDGWYLYWYWRAPSGSDLPEGTYTITANATDDRGRNAVSKPVVITLRQADSGPVG